MPRPTPYDLVFSSLAEERFPTVRAALAADGREATDRDAFLLEREVVLLVRELRPQEGLGDGIDQLAALLHHAYLYWDAGRPTMDLDETSLRELLADPPPEPGEPGETPRALYAAFPERRVWAVVLEGETPEPLEGCFLYATAEELRVLGVFGLRPERMGFSVVEVAGPRPAALARPDGTPLFAPTMTGGAAARLHSLVGAEELLELGWRLGARAASDLSGAARWTY